MRKRSFIRIPCMALALGLALPGCQQPANGTLGSIPRLASVKVAGVEATLGNPSTDWRSATAGDILLTTAQASAAEVVALPEDPASSVYVAAAKSGGVPPKFVASGSFDFDGVNFLLVEVFSPNHDLIFYYRVNVRIIDPLAAGFTVGGRTAVPGTPGASWDDPDIVEGAVVIGGSVAGTNLTVVPTPEVASTAFRYAKVAGSATPVFSSSPTLAAIANGDVIYIEASSGEDRSSTVVYKIRVSAKSDNTNLASISVNGADIGALGAKGANPSAATAPAAYFHMATEAGLANPTVVAVPADAGASVEYAWSPGSYNQSYIVAPELWGDSITTTLSKKSFIYVRVTAPDGSVGYYKFRVTYGSSILSTATSALNGNPVALGTPSSAYATAYANRSTLALAADEGLAGSAMAAVLDDPSTHAVVDFGTGSMGAYGASAPTVWKSGTEAFSAGIASGALITIRITSEDATLVQYYVILAQR
jgi:hypothetical protein